MDWFTFILTYFASKNLSLITAFLCWTPENATKLVSLAGSMELRIRVHNDFHKLPELPAYRNYREGIILDIACAGVENVLYEASKSRAFNHRHSWLLLHEASQNMTYLEEILQDTVILPDSDVVVAFEDTMFDVYKIKIGEPLTTLNLDMDERRDMAELQARLPSAVSRRKNLHNLYLKAATIVSQPQYFKGWSDLTNRQIDTFPKLTYPLLMILAEDLHFRYNLKQIDLYGEERNGSFNGLAGILQRQEVEVGVTSMFMRKDRWRVLHYCSETVELVGAFIFRQPSQSAVSNVFLLPFSAGVWAAAGGVFVGAGALLATLGLVARRRAFCDETAPRLNLAEAFTFAVGAVCQQGSDLSPQILSARILMLFTLLSSLFAFTSYSAKIVSILQAPSNAIQTIDDLTHSPMGMGVQETTYKKVYFAESTDPATRRLYRRKLQPLGDGAYLSVVEGIDRVRKGLFAFQVEQSSGYDVISRTYTEREKCGLKEIQAFKLPMVAVPIRRHSGYRDLFAARLRWHRETGLMDRVRRTWLARRARCDAGGGGFVSVGLADVLPALAALLAGALLAAALLLLELACTRTRASLHSLHCCTSRV
ncbi:glutamate receptor ionotropic, kainate 2-like [Zerene cesonia]|uniref:glutamate receptor ionotropic, kainate 2-like n=1 Tax=Zerene cesonia TaxID=33412 RepID=UPI0018E532EE|nr:glutamate receptor ionotropic, kainate 2-like [Zerene cesonia]